MTFMIATLISAAFFFKISEIDFMTAQATKTFLKTTKNQLKMVFVEEKSLKHDEKRKALRIYDQRHLQ